ncbi:electron transfer flavoprotein subunit alpha/beta [Caballeronia temeraria]|uniref:Electron transfer flavoprotein subunit alpha n=1 Tax=Caballeronia temeraria TaxID=1777137 RepID=A0A158DJ28_9BURK|nr:FAD-binding protein [Caballeronia temeraria]SAK94584.1 electron transfer flavoprotein subunit alpha/beta [Caballeronia temeraria]
MSVLIIAEHDNQTVKAATLHTISAAVELDQEVSVLVVGTGCGAVARAVSRVQGVSKVLLADAPLLGDGLAESSARQILSVAREFDHIFIPETAFGRNVAPRVAAKLDVGQISGITAVISADVFERPIYAGNAVATVQSDDSIKVVTVRSTAFPLALIAGNDAPIVSIPIAEVDTRSRLVERQLTQLERPELTAARVIVSGGRGLGSGANYKQILEPLADKLGAALGASRAAVDAGFVPSDFQVGQTGKIVAPELYVAVGISGAIQHLAGMKESKVIVAVNKDPEAPIFSVADYGLVGDLFKVVPEWVSAA